MEWDAFRTNRREALAAAAGGVAGAAVLGGILLVGRGPGAVGRFAGLVGMEGPPGGSAVAWGVLAAVCLALAAGFGAFLSATATPFVGLLFGLTTRSDALRRLLLPVVRDAAYPASAFALGLAYGGLVGVAFGALAMPAWIAVLGGDVPVPLVDPVALAGWVPYGGVLGLVYAVLTEGGG